MKPITIVAATTLQHKSTKAAIERTLKCLPMPVKEILVFGNNSLIEGSTFVETSISSFHEYNNLILKGIDPYINTDHFLIVQYDGFAVNRNMWDDNFLKYDYIGAPWPHSTDGGINCGNGGFSLRSKKLSSILHNASDIQLDPLNSARKNEDQIICRVYGDHLHQLHGINFAPFEVSSKFSFEKTKHPYIGTSFGMHAVWNIPIYLNEMETIEAFSEIKTLPQKLFNRTLKNCMLRNFEKASRFLKKRVLIDK
jgi:hypothetical protein